MDQQLKQRLIGASVVVALAVIVVPELVKQQPEDGLTDGSSAVISEIPPRPVVTASSPSPGQNDEPSGEPSGGQSTVLVLPGAEPLPTPVEPADLPMPPSASEASPEQDPAASEQATLEQAIAETVEPEPASAESSAPMPAAPVQAAPVQAAPVQAAPVQAAPARTTAAPLSQRLQPEKPIVPAQRPEPKTLSPQPAKPAPVARSEPASKPPAVELPKIQLISRAQYSNTPTTQKVSKDPRWMVQAGSFYIAENASMLREKLRQQSFPATLQTAVVEGRTVYRVQVGPHSTRAEGERTKERLLRDAGIKGSIVPVYN